MRGKANQLATILSMAFLAMAAPAWAQSAGKIELEASEAATRFIGGPIFSSDGKEVGELVDLSVGDDGRVNKLRIRTAAPLGFGARIVEVPGNGFRVRRSTIVLEFPANAIDAMPTVRANAESDEK